MRALIARVNCNKNPGLPVDATSPGPLETPVLHSETVEQKPEQKFQASQTVDRVVSADLGVPSDEGSNWDAILNNVSRNIHGLPPFLNKY